MIVATRYNASSASPLAELADRTARGARCVARHQLHLVASASRIA